MISLITCTGDRPEAFALCEKYMARQTYDGEREWIVIDDGVSCTKPTLGQRYFRFNPSENKRESFRNNHLRALKVAQGDILLFIEDDDWYSPNYVKMMVEEMRDVDMFGEGFAKYYHVPEAKWRQYQNYQNASLAQTGIRRPVMAMMDLVLRTAEKIEQLDGFLWKHCNIPNKRLRWKSTCCVSMKGMPGRPGAGHGHDRRALDEYKYDPTYSKLCEWVGHEDAKAYQEIRNKIKEK